MYFQLILLTLPTYSLHFLGTYCTKINVIPSISRFHQLCQLLEVGQGVDNDLLRGVERPVKEARQVAGEIKVRNFSRKFSELQLQVNFRIVSPLVWGNHDLGKMLTVFAFFTAPVKQLNILNIFKNINFHFSVKSP